MLPYKYKEIFKILEKKAGCGLYGGNSLNTERNRVLVVGAGPVGLRTAVEAQLLGARYLCTNACTLQYSKFLMNV